VADLRAEVGAIAVPTLLVAGRTDLVTTVEDARWLRDRIAASSYVEMDAAHLSNVEVETAFSLHLQRSLA
jgi:3-oxoadipate enol-lactonase